MKIIMPEFVLPILETRTCELVETRDMLDACDIVLIEDLGFTDGDVAVNDESSDTVDVTGESPPPHIEDAEAVMVPWTLSHRALKQLLSAPSLR